jgi:hypothetical protein
VRDSFGREKGLAGTDSQSLIRDVPRDLPFKDVKDLIVGVMDMQGSACTRTGAELQYGNRICAVAK